MQRQYRLLPRFVGVEDQQLAWLQIISINFTLMHALQPCHKVCGDALTVERPTGFGQFVTLGQIARKLWRRLTSLFLPHVAGRWPCRGDEKCCADDFAWRETRPLSEYVHAKTGRDIGISHQNGCFGTVSTCITLRHASD